MANHNLDGFEIVSRHGNYGGLFRALLSFVTLVLPGEPATITIKLRETSTGRMVSVTAKNEAEAMTRLKDRQFD